jgi:hypothetical protein
MIVEKTKVKDGFNYSIRCEFCGEPITETSYEFGMDCKNHCSEKEFKKMFKDGEICSSDLKWIEQFRNIK